MRFLVIDKTNTALISIHPEHVNNILSGQKSFEYRKKASKKIKQIAIYATSPVMKIVALADIEDVISGTPNSVWHQTKGGAGISSPFFKEYFANSKVAYALKIGKISMFKTPLSLSDNNIGLKPPQSYLFLTEMKQHYIESVETVQISKNEICFIGGVHGSGKTFLSSEVFNTFGYSRISASELIKISQGKISENKIVGSIPDNQDFLLKGLSTFSLKNLKIALDGHFCLINSCGNVECIPLETFESIAPSKIVLCNPPLTIIKKRLNCRLIPLALSGSLSEFIKIEKKYAIKIANHLNVPLIEINTELSKEVLFKKIRDWLKNNKC